MNISDAIGGPSAGLMFALSIYDTLTPGSLTDGGAVAGTGTIDRHGTVGEIGGIQQKIAGARQDGAQLFLVPPGQLRRRAGQRPRLDAAGRGRHPEGRDRRGDGRGPPTTRRRCRSAPRGAATKGAARERRRRSGRRRSARSSGTQREAGWDQPARLFALVETARLVEREPQLADSLGDATLTPVEQEGLAAGRALEDQLTAITWPETVHGCAAMVERFVLPPDVEASAARRARAGGVVRLGAPRPPGGPDRGRRDAHRRVVLRPAAARARRGRSRC